MRKLVIGAVIVAAVLAVVAAVAARSDEAQAREDTPTGPADLPSAGGAPLKPGVQSQEDEDNGKPFIGIAIARVPEARASALGIEGGALVVRVLEGSPAQGNLKSGDVITAINGGPVNAPGDVVSTVQRSQPGDVLTFTVLRDGDELEVDVTVGQRPTIEVRPAPVPPRGHAFPFHRVMGMDLKRLARAEVVLEADDGTQTIVAVAGTLAEVNVDESTITLSPRDGSDDVEYEITDEARIFEDGHPAELNDLDEDDWALVVTVDGVVRLVIQREPPPYHVLAPLAGPLLGLPVPPVASTDYPFFHERYFSALHHKLDRLVRAEIVFVADNGFKTVEAVAGTLAEVDEDASTITLAPRDGSEDIEYQVTDDTILLEDGHRAELNDLDVDARTIVVTLDGATKVVFQGRLLEGPWPPFFGDLGFLRGKLDRLVRAEIVLQGDDGQDVYRAVAGELTEVDEDASAITVAPRDGSDDVEFQVGEEALVIEDGHRAELGDLDTGQDVVVVTLNDDVKLVLQGKLPAFPHGRIFIKPHAMPFFQWDEAPGLALPGLRERLRDILLNIGRFFQKAQRENTAGGSY